MAGTSLENLFIKIVKSYFLDERNNTEKLIAEYFNRIGNGCDIDKDREKIIKTIAHKLTEYDLEFSYLEDENEDVFKWLAKRKISKNNIKPFFCSILRYFAKNTAKRISTEIKNLEKK